MRELKDGEREKQGRSQEFLLGGPSCGEIIESSGGPRYLSTIPLKNFHLFKIAESVINLCLKKISN